MSGGSFTEPCNDGISREKAMVMRILEKNVCINSFIGNKEICRRWVGHGKQIQTVRFENAF
jgi:hypothetical protein